MLDSKLTNNKDIGRNAFNQQDAVQNENKLAIIIMFIVTIVLFLFIDNSLVTT